jgi:hypothetical protein
VKLAGFALNRQTGRTTRTGRIDDDFAPAAKPYIRAIRSLPMNEKPNESPTKSNGKLDDKAHDRIPSPCSPAISALGKTTLLNRTRPSRMAEVRRHRQ